MISEAYKVHANKLVDAHDQVLESTLDKGSYSKLYSFKHVLNGFAVHTTPSQVVVFLVLCLPLFHSLRL